MTHQEFNFNLHNTEFFGQSWKAEKSKAIVALVHGMGEYAWRYERTVVPALLKQSFAVISYDQFGHAGVEGQGFGGAGGGGCGGW